LEVAGALTLYGLYELARGLVADRAEADAHAHRLVAVERSPHVFVKANVQRAVQTLPGLNSLLGKRHVGDQSRLVRSSRTVSKRNRPT